MTWVSEGEYGKLWFDADNADHARQLLEQVANGELAMGNLPNYDYSVKGGDGFEFEQPEEVK
jgi:hypothetical protein